MNKFLLSTALVAATAVGAAAQTTMTGDDARTAARAFLASDFTGMTLHTLQSEEARALRDPAAAEATAGPVTTDAERARINRMNAEVFLADRDAWESVGAIDDVVMTQDGDVRGVLLDVGGFLGFGARTVMVDIEDLHFVSEDPEAEDIGDFSVLIAMSADELEALPEWEEAMLRTGRDVRPAGAGDHAAAGEGAGRAVFGAEHAMLEGADRTADRLLGADVYDAAGDHVGSIDDVVLGDDDAVQGVIVDVGGFLGIGAHTVSLPIEDARIGWSDDDVRVQVAMTAEELEEMPEHEG